MIKRDELIDYIYSVFGEDLLAKAASKDEMANGIQIVGGEGVEKVAIGVTANFEFLEKASKWGSNFCIFHHGLDLRPYKSRFTKTLQKRLKIIFQKETTVLGFHYALDAHPEIGNNALIVKKLGAKVKGSLFGESGLVAEFEKEQDLHDLAHKCEEIFNHDVLVSEVENKERIKKVGVLSGASKDYAENVLEMEKWGIDLFITGEQRESTPNNLLDAGINTFFAGHYATEVLGISELGKLIQEEFGAKLQVKFIDIPNPI